MSDDERRADERRPSDVDVDEEAPRMARRASEPGDAEAESIASSSDSSLELFTAMAPLHAAAHGSPRGGASSAATLDEIRKAKAVLNRILRKKQEALAKRGAILRLKYTKYKCYNDCVQICMIIISSWLTLLESIKVHVVVEDTSRATTATFSLLPLFLSTSVTVSLSILKFKKLTEKMEEQSKVQLRAQQTYSLLKKVEEQLTAALTAEAVLDIFREWTESIFDTYNSTQEGIASCLTLSDYSKNSAQYHELTLALRLDEQRFSARCAEIAEGGVPEPPNAAAQLVSAMNPMRWWGCCAGCRQKPPVVAVTAPPPRARSPRATT